MAEFLNPFTGLAPARKLTERKFARTDRVALSAGERAVRLYKGQADATEHKLALWLAISASVYALR